MLKLFKSNFKTTNDCIILAGPLIIFISLLQLYATYIVKYANTTSKLVLGITTIIVMFAGFLSAWLYMTKKTIALSKKVFIFDVDRVKALGYLAMSLSKGVGRLIIPILFFVISLGVIYTLLFHGVTYLIEQHFGEFTLNFKTIEALLYDNKNVLDELFEALSIKEITAINTWFIAINICIATISYFTLLWVPEIVYTQKNPIKALIASCKKMMTGIPETIMLFFYIVMLTLIAKIVTMLVLIHPILYFFVLIYYYYYIVYVVVLLFSYYEQRYTKS